MINPRARLRGRPTSDRMNVCAVCFKRPTMAVRSEGAPGKSSDEVRHSTAHECTGRCHRIKRRMPHSIRETLCLGKTIGFGPDRGFRLGQCVHPLRDLPSTRNRACGPSRLQSRHRWQCMDDVAEGTRLEDKNRPRVVRAPNARAICQSPDGPRDRLGKPAARIFFCAVWMSYSNRRKLDEIFINVINDIRRTPVAVAWLADTADVNEILLAHLELDLIERNTHHGAIADVSPRRMRMTEETDARVLIAETCARIELVENVTPLVRGIEGGVNDGKIPHLPHEASVR